MDDIDRAQAREAEFTADALARQARAAPEARLQPLGVCHYCGEPIKDGRLFCDADCRGDWEHEEKLLAQNGKRRALVA